MGGYIILILLVLWLVVLPIFIWIKESVENSIIRKYKTKEELTEASKTIMENIEPQIIQIKTDISSLRDYAFKRLPALEERIDRDKHPWKYTPNKKYKKKRRWYVY